MFVIGDQVQLIDAGALETHNRYQLAVRGADGGNEVTCALESVEIVGELTLQEFSRIRPGYVQRCERNRDPMGMRRHRSTAASQRGVRSG